MADTGRTVFADGLFADDLFAAGLWATTEPVEVPDVVGETQAAGTATLEAALFAVSVTYEYSDSVPEGEIISQAPVGGVEASEGSTVGIVVSGGVRPAEDAQQGGGGFGFANLYEIELQRRRRRKKEREEIEEATEQIADETDRQIAQLLRTQEAKDEKRKELQRLAEIVRQNADIEAARQYGEKVAKAYERALMQGNFSALEALDRELKKVREEEEALLLQAFMLE
jgi:hypothetical protein